MSLDETLSRYPWLTPLYDDDVVHALWCEQQAITLAGLMLVRMHITSPYEVQHVSDEFLLSHSGFGARSLEIVRFVWPFKRSRKDVLTRIEQRRQEHEYAMTEMLRRANTWP